jgi:hypothetical protein
MAPAAERSAPFLKAKSRVKEASPVTGRKFKPALLPLCGQPVENPAFERPPQVFVFKETLRHVLPDQSRMTLFPPEYTA